MKDDFIFFSNDYDDSKNNLEKYLNKINKVSKIYKEYSLYIEAENDLEDMIRDDILNIFVDENGVFHYEVTDTVIKALPEGYTPRMSTFADILAKRNLNIDKYNRYRLILRRKNP